MSGVFQNCFVQVKNVFGNGFVRSLEQSVFLPSSTREDLLRL